MKPLSTRQREVLRLAAGGHTSVQAGRILGVRSTTVERHLHEIYRVLGARDRANAVVIAIHRGELSLGDVARIADAASVRAAERRQEAADGPQGASEPSGAVPVVRGAARAAQGRTEPRGEAAA